MARSLLRSFARGAAFAGAAALGLACSKAEKGTLGPPPTGGSSGSADVVATIGGEQVTMAELDAWIKEDLFKRESEGKNASAMFEMRSDALDRMIGERLLAAEAKKRNLTTEAVLQEEAAKAPPVTDDAVKAFYEANKARLGGQTLEQISPRIRQHLEQQARNETAQKFVAGLREAAGVSVQMEQPRVQVSGDGISRGPADAPVTMIEFSDYQCPFCRRAEPTVMEVLARYPDKLRFVYRHFPLDMHPRARPAAEAAECAGEQGRFWEYHDKLFAGSGFEEADFERYAKEIGLDTAKWQACRADDHTLAKIAADEKAGSDAGVTGTPAFFVNGIMISGARPLDAFTKIIDSELARAGSAAPTASAGK
ncbi:MAG TPA: thioredoxin domain-containing protein [Myxococcota bacterium]|jgi:protein-disulfide isomerase|nr:thioredoxin domain-containing protein [Myxococcota bacterium]